MESKFARIAGISTALPEGILTNSELAEIFPVWSAESIYRKVGVRQRHIADEHTFSSDLGLAALENLLSEYRIKAEDIDILIVVTQTPDRLFPGVSSVIHGRAGLKSECGAFDVNLGCSGYVYALGLAKSLIESGQAVTVVVITADTYSKILNPLDKSVRAVFGDGASATLLLGDGSVECVSPVSFGSDGSRYGQLVVPGVGLKSSLEDIPQADPSRRGLEGSGYDLYMDGPGIFSFTLEVAKDAIKRTLTKAKTSEAEISHYVFHQANEFMLRHLQRKLEIPDSKFVVEMESWGNVVSSSIPFALKYLSKSNPHTEMVCLLFGFGVGLSWGGTVVNMWPWDSGAVESSASL